ncbi:MAG TPA: LptE family protein [Paludibacteraceae bacterium]|nr:LptE family protein [Paludibacteraceae bacterium]
MKKNITPITLFIFSYLLAISCSVSYKFNGASIDYSKVKTVAIADFQNYATLVYPPLAEYFSEQVRDIFSKQTRLTQVRRDGDLSLEGEIVEYSLQPLSIGADALAAETRLTITVRVRFANNVNPSEDFEHSFSATRNFPSTSTLNDVQDQLMQEIIEELVDNIYNATVANW